MINFKKISTAKARQIAPNPRISQTPNLTAFNVFEDKEFAGTLFIRQRSVSPPRFRGIMSYGKNEGESLGGFRRRYTTAVWGGPNAVKEDVRERMEGLR